LTRRGMFLLSIVLLSLVATCIRLVPLQWSQLPYNIDGLSELRIVEDIRINGNIEFSPDTSHAEDYTTDMPLLGVFISFASSSIGLPPVSSTFFTTALLGAATIAIIADVFVSRIPDLRSFVASGVVLALLGSLVFSAGCTWKETLGFCLLAMVLSSFLLRADLRYRAVLSISLLLLVFTHHHAAIVSFLLVSYAVAIEV
jgi:hypothetical protein